MVQDLVFGLIMWDFSNENYTIETLLSFYTIKLIKQESVVK